MAGKVYSAGTIFLQVVPVFKDVMDDIRRNAKDWDRALGDEMEKSGKEAGKRANKAMGEELGKGQKEAGSKAGEDYSGAFAKTFKDGVAKVNRELEPINLKVEKNGIRRELAQTRLRGVQADAKNIRVKVDVDEATKGVEAFRKRVERALPDIDIPVRLETKQADRQLGAFERKFRDIAKKAARELGDNISPELRRIKAELDALGDTDIGIDLDSGAALAKLTALQGQLKAVSAQDVNVEVDIDAAAAEAHLGTFFAMVKAVDGKDIDVKVDVDTGGAAAKVGGLAALLSLFSRNGSSAAATGDTVANSFRAFNGVVLASVTLLPALVPALAAVGGGLLALLPILAAVTAGIGAVVIGFSGIGDAVSALGDVQDSAAKDSAAAGKTMASSANAVADAQTALARAEQAAGWARADAARAVADAKRAAADAIEDALDQQREAQEAYRDSVKEVREAERDLAEARKEAAKDQMDLDNQIAQNKLDIESGVIGVFNAQVNFNAVMADGSATNQERDAARIALEQAELNLKELRQLQLQLAEEKAKFDKKGVDGSDKVKDAQDALTTALEAQKDAQDDLKDAAEAVTKARVEGARRIADAERNAARVAISSAQSVADAKKNLAQAEQGYQDALAQTGDIGSAAQQKLDLAMSKLGPTGRKFAVFIFGLKQQFYGFRDAIQEALLPGVQRAIEDFMKASGGRLTNFFVRMARVSSNLFENLGKALRGPVFREFFAMMDRFGPKLLRQFGNTSINWLKIFARFMTIAGPAALALSKAMLKISKAVLDWTKSKDGTETIQRFLEYAQKVGPKVADFFWNLTRAIVNIMEGLAPFGELVLGVLDSILKWIAGMDPKVLGAIITMILGLVVAFQLANLAVFIAFGAFSALLTPVGLIAFAVVAIIAALTVLYIRFESVRKVIDAIFGFITDHWKGILQIFLAWVALPVALYWKFEGFRKLVNKIFEGLVWYFQNVVIPMWKIMFEIIAAVFVGIYNFWQTYLQPTLKAIGKIVVWLVKNIVVPYFKLMWTVIKAAFTVIRTIWTHILWPILDLIGTIIVKLFVAYWKPKVDKMREVWRDFATGVKFLWDKYGQPIFDYIKDTALPKLQTAFETVVGAIGKAWGALKKYVAEPIFGIIDVILNKGIIAGFNTIAKFVGSDPMKEINLPFTSTGEAVKKADGGVLPGYTPGRDVHKFYSPTAGQLHLSGGEAIMRPEWTAAMGKGTIDQMNFIARTRGAKGIQEAMGTGRGRRFARGGIFFPLPGGHYANNYPGHDGVDINVGSGSDDLGMMFYSATSGKVNTTGYSRGYGNAIFIQSPYGELVYGHSIDGSIRVGVGQSVSPGTPLAQVGMTGHASAPHLHFGFPGGTYAAAAALLSGAPVGAAGVKGHVAPVHHYPDFLAKIVKNPLDWAKSLIEQPVKDFKGQFDSPMASMIGDLPGKLVKKMASKALDMIPAVAAFNATGHLIKGAAHGAADAVGLKNGGILPYNGVMKYDAGGYLPPGLTSVVNLTGRPEPVLTHDQFQGRGGDGEIFHYEPHFEGSDLTSDDIANDMDRARRKMRREGRYRRNR
jgi:murein DD-endopeptidase MepM/ murein hydrolase activator NlpD